MSCLLMVFVISTLMREATSVSEFHFAREINCPGMEIETLLLDRSMKC